tara:strand:- start:2709 stop:4964 length:2256 start_codon:yes stop_codon:yes gene_type:complete
MWVLERLRGKTLVLLLAVPLALVLLANQGWLETLDRRMLELKFRWLTMPASGEIAVVEIDAGTIDAIGIWPFPRRNFADLIQQLDQAGARSIAMDIDFSAYSTGSDDWALRAAIKGSSAHIILPTFVQQAGRLPEDNRLIERSATQFEKAGGSLGAVNVTPEDDSRIWRYAAFSQSSGIRRPSMAALLAEGQLPANRFTIDFGIDYSSIPFLSMRQVLEGNFDPGLIAGKRIVVGATSIELGDQFPVPRYGFLPGVYVQVLAAESLLQGRALQTSSPVTLWIGMLFLLPVGLLVLGRSWRAAVIATAAAGGGILVACFALQAVSPFILQISAWLSALAGWWSLRLLKTLHEQGLRLFRQRLSSVYMRELMRRVVDDSFDGILMTDSRGFIERCNGTAEMLLGVHAKQVLGKNLSSVFPDKVYAQIRPHLEDQGAGERFELTIPHEDDRAREVEMTIGVIRLAVSKSPFERRTTGRQVHVLTFRDISGRKRAENEKTVALIEAQRANEVKSQFLASVSHELRTPLNAILGFSEIMSTQAFGSIGNQRYLEYAESINHSGALLLELIDSILDISRMESGEGRLTLEDFETGKLLDECEEVLHGLTTNSPRSLSIQVEPDAAVLHADRSLLRQVFINLLTNAVKFTDEGGRIGVSVRRAGDGRVVIDVSDNGCGIAEEEIEQIFEPFRQASSAYVRKASGSGLGLYIVHRIVLAHGGDIKVESELGVGTTVRIWLPTNSVVPQISEPAEENSAV